MPLSLQPDLTEGVLVAYFDGKPIRICLRENGPWFVLQDLAVCLGITNPRHLAARLSEDLKGVVSNDTPGGRQDMAAVNEAGLYMAIFTSRKKTATRFQQWVTREVLPGIRQNGFYALPGVPYSSQGDQAMVPALSGALQTLSTDVKDVFREVEETATTIRSAAKMFDRHQDWAEGTMAELRPLLEEAIPAARGEIQALRQQVTNLEAALAAGTDTLLPEAAFSYAHIRGIPCAIICQPDLIEGVSDEAI